MKKFLTLLTIALGLVLVNHSCKPEPEECGSIYGIVTDFATGEPVKNANVQLRPSGETSLTGSDGRYEFLDLKNGSYSITVSKTGYTDLVDDYIIVVEDSKTMRRDVQIEVLPTALRIVDGNGIDITELDFGVSTDYNSRSFNVFNGGTEVLNYQITKTVDWIENIENATGAVQHGQTKGVVVVINREKMVEGENKTTIHITSNNGNKELVIIAEKKSDISTLDATDITKTSVTLNGSINGNINYSEKGFYFGENTSSMTKIDVDGKGSGVFMYNKSNLEVGKKYYYRAYMVKNSETIYGEIKEFTTLEDNYGHKYVDLGLPSGLKWAECNAGSGSPEDYGSYLDYDEACSLSWGGNWRTPTKEDFDELVANCAWKWTQQNGINGYKVTGTNGNSIFLPAAGCNSTQYKGQSGYYWSSSTYDGDGKEYYLFFNEYHHNVNRTYGLDSFSVRPVLGENDNNNDDDDNNGTDNNKLEAPTNVRSTILDETRIKLEWNTVDNANSYNVYDHYVFIGNVAVNYCTVAMVPGEESCFTVTAVNTYTESQHSDKECVTIETNEVEYTDLSYDFNYGLEGWTTIDGNYDGHEWYHSSDCETFHEVLVGDSHSGYGHICSESYCNLTESPKSPDDYIVSPEKIIPSSSTKMTFYACSQDEEWPNEHFGVAVSTTDNIYTSSFKTIAEWTISGKSRGYGERSLRQTSWKKYEVDLSSYAGQEIYVAIRHFNCTDMFMLLVDDVEITKVEL